MASLLVLREFALAGTLLIVCSMAMVRLRARRMSFGTAEFHYDGWLGSIRVPYSEIVKVEHALDLGYPHNRLHGPLEYRITIRSGKRWICLLWFEDEGARTFQRRIIERDTA
jgi:hypothetical protein